MEVYIVVKAIFTSGNRVGCGFAQLDGGIYSIKAILISGLVFLLDTHRLNFKLFFVCEKKIVCFGMHADPPKCKENTDIVA